MILAILDQFRTVEFRLGSDLDDEQFLDDLILDHIWNLLHKFISLQIS